MRSEIHQELEKSISQCFLLLGGYHRLLVQSHLGVTSRKQCALVKDDTVIIIKRKLGEAEAMRSMCQAWRSREDLEGCCIGSLAGTWGEH